MTQKDDFVMRTYLVKLGSEKPSAAGKDSANHAKVALASPIPKTVQEPSYEQVSTLPDIHAYITSLPDPPDAPYKFNWVSTNEQMQEILKDIRNAIHNGIHPQRISQGTSGAYFVKNNQHQIVGVFKPKDEEPYASLNPKWTKWLHRICCPCLFGRSCLRTNDGYLSEVGASMVDRFFQFNIVPRTDLVKLSAPSLAYPLWRRAKWWQTGSESQLPEKIGSFQLFVSEFRPSKDFIDELDRMGPISPELHYAFQLEFERMVMLDYIIRNTDRTMDNWLVHLSWQYKEEGEPEDLSDATSDMASIDLNSPVVATYDIPKPYHKSTSYFETSHYRKSQRPFVKIAGIDNGLAFPYKHPDNWRSYPYSWANLPFARIPFSEENRQRFLPLLRNYKNIEHLFTMLLDLFKVDDFFDWVHFNKQIAVIRGQISNLIVALEQNKSPIELVSWPHIIIQEDRFLVHKSTNTILDTEYPSSGNKRWRQVADKRPWFSCC